jgi:trans-aconitate methyltransferase
MSKPNLMLPPTYTRRSAEKYFPDMGNGERFQSEVYKLASLFDPESVLDIGCGDGFKLRKYFPKAVRLGVDVPETVKWLKDKYLGDNWSAYDYSTNLTIKFNLIIIADVLEHLMGPIECLFWAMDQLEPGGVIVLSTPARDFLGPNYVGTNGPPRNSTHVQEWTNKEFVAFCSQFMAVQYHGINMPHTSIVIGKCS